LREGAPRAVFVPPWSPADTELCRRLGIELAATGADDQWQLQRTGLGSLQLRSPAAHGPLVFALDLGHGALATRLRTARKDQPLPRALGLPRRATPPAVFDATAGLGRDALLLARLGCPIVAWERQPVLAALLADAAARLGFEHVQVHGGDATAALAALPDDRRPDAVYLDPMFAISGSSQVKKDMQICRLLAGPPTDTDALVAAAFRAARERVVVKRHPQHQPLRPQPSFTVNGERVRFDVYLIAQG